MPIYPGQLRRTRTGRVRGRLLADEPAGIADDEAGQLPEVIVT